MLTAIKNPKLHGLPAGHKELEWIESSGTQYINTGIVPNFNYKMEVVGSFVSGNRHFGIDGGNAYTQTWYGFLLANTDGYSAWGTLMWAKSTKGLLGMSGNIDDTYKITIDKTGIKVDDVQKVSFGSSGSDLETTKSLWLFRSNTTGDFNKGVSREQSAKIWDDNGELVRDFIPDEYNGQVGMYDLVSQTFFPNSGTGSFIAGPEVPALIPVTPARKVKSKNLFDGVSSKWNGVQQRVGEKIASAANCSSAKILASKGDTFTIKKHSASPGTKRTYIGEFDSNNICLVKAGYSSITDGVTYTPTNDDCVFVHIEWAVGGNTDDIMLNEGSTALPYEPYGDKIVSLYPAHKSELPPYPVFANNTWKQICQAGRNNEIPSTWLVGDTKTWTSKSGITYTARLIDKQADRYTYADTNEGTHAVIELTGTDLYKLGTTEAWQMNASNTNAGGWASSAMRTTTMPLILADISDDLAPFIPEVNVLSGTGGSTTSGTSSSTNKIFLPCEWELFGKKTYSVGQEESPKGQFDWYVGKAYTNRVKHYVGETSGQRYFTRSPRSGDSRYFCFVYADGGGGYISATDSYGVALYFAI